LKDVFALVATLGFIVIGGVVGVRLLVLARRTRQPAELWLGLALFSIAGLAYPLVITAGAAPTGLQRVLAAVGNALLCFGWSCLWLFTWTTFRREATWARILTISAISATVLLSGRRIVRLAVDDDLTLSAATIDGLGPLLLAMAEYVWTSIEAFRYRAMLQRRVRLGLADPTVANRFLLWGLMGVFSFLSLVMPVTGAFHRGPDFVTFSRIGTGGSGIVCAVVMYLAFMAPQPYLDWVRRRAAAPAL
jgi:hypothetical protein